MGMMSNGVVGASVLLLAMLMTGVIRRYARARLLDHPNERSSHHEPTPRGGGLAIVVAFSLALAYGCSQALVPASLGLALSGLLPLATIGFIDDHGHVPARWRLLLQILAALWSLYWIGGLERLTVAGYSLELGGFGHLFGLLFIVWMLNLFNFMDGIDGIAGVETVTLSLSAALLMAFPLGLSVAEGGFAPLMLAAATAGFLLWNWPPARIFMGDVGSGVLGFVLAVLALWSASQGPLSLAVWMILGGVFWVDATWTLLVRMLRGERFYEAHRSHAYQHASRRLGNHRSVTLTVLGINLLWLLPLALGAVIWPGLEWLFWGVAYVPLIALAVHLGAGKP